MAFVWLNGEFVEESHAAIGLRDTGLLHAAGVFTTMRSINGRVERLDAHLRRLRDSCEALFIPLLPKDDILWDALTELLRLDELTDARLRLTVTRGAATNDPMHGLRLTPNVFITASTFEPYPAEYYERGMTVILIDDQKLNPYDLQAGHKTLNYFSRLTALRSASQRQAGEALWFDVHNLLQSGSISNIFLVKDGVLTTPPTNLDLRDKSVAAESDVLRSAVLPGVTRSAVIEHAHAASISVRLGSADVNALLAADEIFLTNSIMQIMPVCRIERHAVGNDKPGPITRRLSELLRSSS